MFSRRLFLAGAAVLGAVGPRYNFGSNAAVAGETFSVAHTDAEWRKLLTANQYAVLRKEATERPFTSALLTEHGKGNFACDQDAFSSTTKFESGTGWPSFWAALDGAVGTTRDGSFGMTRSEIHCSRCGGHLGHVFPDGPKPTGLRYCMNGIAMKFHPVSA